MIDTMWLMAHLFWLIFSVSNQFGFNYLLNYVYYDPILIFKFHFPGKIVNQLTLFLGNTEEWTQKEIHKHIFIRIEECLREFVEA